MPHVVSIGLNDDPGYFEKSLQSAKEAICQELENLWEENALSHLAIEGKEKSDKISFHISFMTDEEIEKAPEFDGW